MVVDVMARRIEFVESHCQQEYRTFKCSGSCGIQIDALAGAKLWCGQPDCRGVMKPSYRVSSKRLGSEQFQAARDRGENPRFTPRFLNVLPTDRAWKSSDDVFTHGGDLGGLFGGIALAQELVIGVLIDGGTGEWSWGNTQGEDHDC